MRKALLSTLAAFLLVGTVQAPSNADAGEMAKKAFKVPIVLTSFAAGTAVGTPIAIGRKSMSNTKETCDNLAGDGGMIKKGACSVVAVPVGVGKGTFQGVIIGPKNAWKNSSEKPFSKDVFSLADLD